MTASLAPEFVTLQQAVVGRYSLERELGRGGMGIVFLARDVALDRLVAIKLLPPALAARAELRERFLREARTAARLSHPNIVAIHAVEEAGDLVFFVMAFVDGETLGERLRTRGVLTPHDAARMLQETAWALGYAHGRGVVHRDVKPDNIMLERSTGRAIVMDFGIAGAADDRAETFGTAQYVSPEQADGAALDGRSDLYSLGVVAFLALTGQLPFDGPDAHTLLAMHVSRPAPTVLSIAPGLPRKLAHAVDRCLCKRPDDRFADGEALAEAVGQAAERPRELPVAVRVWLTRNTQPTVAHLVFIPFVSAPALIFGIAAIYQGALWSIGVGIGLLGIGLVGPGAITGLYRLLETRKLLRGGYGLEDIRLAVRQNAQRRREELAVEYDKDPSLPAKIVYRGMLLSAGVMAVSFVGLLTTRGRDLYGYLLLGSSLTTGIAAVVQTFTPGVRRTKDTVAELRARFWSSKMGRWVDKVARLGLKRQAVPAELTYRPTEMAIGLAADALFESLPKEQRRELKELPDVLERLQQDAALMRKTVDELGDAIDSLERDTSPAAEQLKAELCAKRDEASKRLAAAVAALESVRLSLLRLKAGTGSLSQLTADLTAARSLTEDLGAARDLAATIDRSADGHAEVAKLLGGAHG